MPGWYIHMEAAKKAADRLRAGQVPPEFPGGVAGAKALGDLAYKWRNYLSLGAIGPDIFFLLPDFKSDTGNVLLHFVDWVRDVYEVLDSELLSKLETWFGPVSEGSGDILNHVTGDVLAEIGQLLQQLSKALQDAVIDLIVRLWDWFGLLSSGVGEGVNDKAFYWSDIFHYRKTYAFPRKLFANADTDQKKAFALGWMSHCATDVTGHPFVNSKCGGPYRLHWQRHHVIENHMDALVYQSQHHGNEPYGEIATSALHFRLAFRQRDDAPYSGASDAPAYDYFAGFPSYDPSPGGDFQRGQLWDLDSGDLPEELCAFVIKTMKEVFTDGLENANSPAVSDAPLILTADGADVRDLNTGRPSVKTLQDTFWSLYHYVKFMSTDGYSPRRPPEPDFIDASTFSPPPPPGSDAGVGDDPSRGNDPAGGDDDFNFLDFLFALFAFAAWVAELGVWLATLPIALVNEMVTFPGRSLLYDAAVGPAWSLYLAARQPLVMSGFLVPRPEEISRGLVELGVSTKGQLQSLAAALASPTGNANVSTSDEPSGRLGGQPYGLDPAFPRAIVRDNPSTISDVVGYVVGSSGTDPLQASEFLAPWKYPEQNHAGQRNGWEPPLTHPGPYERGQDATVLMGNDPGTAAARQNFEQASSPKDTDQRVDSSLRNGEHLGDPVDYSVYLMTRLVAEAEAGGSTNLIPDFNLDGDRGYAYQCWDWNRNPNGPTCYGVHGKAASDRQENTSFQEPCTVPHGFDQANYSAKKYDATVDVQIHYPSEGPVSCAANPITPDDVQAGMPPTGGLPKG